MSTTQTFDAIVIGAGPAGEVAAGRLAERGGKSVALVEQELVGGECAFWACMPSKALLRPGELLAEAARVPGAEAVGGHGVDVAAALARRDEVIHSLSDDGQLGWLEQRGVTLLRGRARLDGPRRVRVGDVVYEAREAVFVATGSSSLLPPIPGLAESQPWTNREGTTSDTVPERLTVLGGGVVGVELAQAWSSLGAQVTVIEAAPRLIAREEPFASMQVAEGLQARGVELRIGAKAVSVSRAGEETTVELEDGTSVVGDRLLVAIGRRTRTDDLGLESVGLEPGKPIAVDDALRVPGQEWLYAIGDVNGRAQLTHMGKYQARIAVDALLGSSVRLRIDGARSPRVIFTDPTVAAVGLTLEGAQEAGIAAREVDLSTEGTAAGSFHGHGAGGTTRFVLDTDRDVLVGATFVGPDVAELLHAATIAIAAEIPLTTLAHAIPTFPTRSELWLELQEAAAA